VRYIENAMSSKRERNSCKGCFNTRVLSTWLDDLKGIIFYFSGAARAIRCEFKEFKLCLYSLYKLL